MKAIKYKKGRSLEWQILMKLVIEIKHFCKRLIVDAFRELI
jgi:hypothetical protein